MDDIVRSRVHEREIGMSEIGTGELLGQDVMDSGAGNRHVRQLDPTAAPREMLGGPDGNPLLIVAPLSDGRAIAQNQIVQRFPSGAERSRRRRSPQRRLSWPLPGAATDRCQQESYEKSSRDVHGVSTTLHPAVDEGAVTVVTRDPGARSTTVLE
jgi:hypothetical protein